MPAATAETAEADHIDMYHLDEDDDGRIVLNNPDNLYLGDWCGDWGAQDETSKRAILAAVEAAEAAEDRYYIDTFVVQAVGRRRGFLNSRDPGGVLDLGAFDGGENACLVC